MSRCFPYPPPGYAPSSNGNTSLIDSIKLQSETEKRKKEKKRERKDRRKEKKHEARRKEKKDKAVRHSPDGHVKEKLYSDAKSKSLDEAKVEGLESSSLSEEHGEPVMLVVPSSSSDSTENSNKKRPLSLISGNAIRMLHPCCISGNTMEHEPRCRREDQPCASVAICKVGQIEDSRPEELHASMHSADQIHSLDASGPAPSFPAAASSKRSKKAYMQFKDIMESWFPPSLHHHHLAPCADDDTDWLFRSNNEEFGQPEKRRKPATDTMPCSSTSSFLWPRAHYLPEVTVFALPYTVPF